MTKLNKMLVKVNDSNTKMKIEKKKSKSNKRNYRFLSTNLGSTKHPRLWNLF